MTVISCKWTIARSSTALWYTRPRDIHESSFEITDDSIIYRNIPISRVIKTSYFFSPFLYAHSGICDRLDFGAGAYPSSLGGKLGFIGASIADVIIMPSPILMKLARRKKVYICKFAETLCNCNDDLGWIGDDCGSSHRDWVMTLPLAQPCNYSPYKGWCLWNDTKVSKIRTLNLFRTTGVTEAAFICTGTCTQARAHRAGADILTSEII